MRLCLVDPGQHPCFDLKHKFACRRCKLWKFGKRLLRAKVKILNPPLVQSFPMNARCSSIFKQPRVSDCGLRLG